MKLNVLQAAIIAAFVINISVLADEFHVGNIVISHAWSPPSPGAMPTAAGYLTLQNHGVDTDTLLSVSAEMARSVTLHATLMDEGIMRMREQAVVEIPPKGEVRFEPGGLHIMFMGLAKPLEKGETFPVTLTFERVGPVTIEMTVLARDEAMSGDHSPPANK